MQEVIHSDDDDGPDSAGSTRQDPSNPIATAVFRQLECREVGPIDRHEEQMARWAARVNAWLDRKGWR